MEGFYGQPWSHEARLSQLDFYGRNKMNVYIYGPKDDPYHSTPNWRKPYPEKEAKQLQELVERAKQNNVIFYWAIHPGQDIQWNDKDRDLLLKKFESMYDLGVRGFAVFFDDISGEGTKADKQAELLNYIDDHFIQAKGRCVPPHHVSHGIQQVMDQPERRIPHHTGRKTEPGHSGDVDRRPRSCHY